MKKTLFIAMFIVAALVLVSGQSYAVTGHCANCHTMHNSQNGASVTGGAPNAVLLKANCFGCHTTTGDNRNESLGGTPIPRVSHNDTVDLAGGNFKYIYGAETKGHNVVGTPTSSGALIADSLIGKSGVPAPGGTQEVPVTCAGTNGCHGDPTKSDQMVSIGGAHHTNNPTSSPITDGSTLGKSYRFLSGVVGIEVEDRENSGANNHNEYISSDSGISKKLCARCHSLFHNNSQSTGTWTRHPVDVDINVTGKSLLGNYGTAYSVDVPIGRPDTTITDSAQSEAGDTVMCLSCHKAHATNYPDMLRWDYAAITAGASPANTSGCNKCHAK